MISTVFYTLLALVTHVIGFQEHCSCGYGGLCHNFENLTDCYNDRVGRGFYKLKDGISITDHCSRNNSCPKGTCVQTFGGYYCDCPWGYYGMKCEHHFEEIATYGYKNEIYVYYQTQPAPESDHTFTVVWDSKLVGFKSEGRYWVNLRVNVSDDTYYNPLQNSIEVKNIKEVCQEESKKYPKFYDIRVCDFLPDGEVSAFTFDATLRIPLHRSEGLLYVPGKKEPVGRNGKVTVVTDITTGGKTMTTFQRTYNVFTYLWGRVTHDCLVDFSFQGCETDYKWPTNHARSSKITIRPFVNLINCTGGNPVGNKWTMSENIDSDDVAGLERELDLFDNKWSLEIAPTSLSPAIHRIGYILFIRGVPPVYGGTSVFKKTGQCFLRVSVGNADARIKGGHSRTSSCYSSLQLPIAVPNRGYKTSELHFMVSCNVTDDPECKPTLFTVPIYTKLNSPCDTYYEFFVTVIGRVKGEEGPKQNLTAVVHFVKSETANYIECIFNCYPIDPQYRILAFVESVPYTPRRVTWNWTFAGKQMTARDGAAVAFFPLTSSRIYRLNGNRFLDGNKTRAEASVTVYLGGPLYVARNFYTANYLPLMEHFKLELVSEDGPLYRYYWTINESSPLTDALLLYFPITLRVYQIHDSIRGCIILNETTYYKEIYFTPTWEKVKLCVLDRVPTEGCTEPAPVSTSNKGSISVEDLGSVLATGDSTTCFGQAIRFLYRGLWKNESEPLDWSISMEERTRFIDTLLKVKHTRPLDQLFLSQITSVLYYSKEGNEEQRLHPFKDPELDDFDTMVEWIELRKKTTELFRLTSSIAKEWALSIKKLHFKLRVYQFGTILDELFYMWSLGYSQGGFMTNFIHVLEVDYPEYLSAELNHHTTSFAGLKVGLNRTFPRGPEQPVVGYTDFFFGPYEGPDDWLTYAAVYLPEVTSFGFETEILSLVIFAAKNLKLDTVTVSPAIYITVIRSNGSVLPRFPGNDYYYNITLPRMVKGELDLNRTNEMKRHTMVIPLDKNLKQRFFHTYKVVFPAKYESWNEYIYLDDDTPIKAKITFNHLPDLSEVELEPDLPVFLSNFTGLYYSVIPLTATEDNDGLPSYFYIGLWPGSKVPPGKYVAYSFTTQVDVCQSMDISGGDTREKCKGLGVSEGNLVEIHCQCSMLSSVIKAYSQDVRRVEVVASQIDFSLPEEIEDIHYDLVIVAVLAAIIVIIIVFACVKDIFRRRNHLIYLKDTYMSDTHVLVVGVFTSFRFLSGTISDVAIKIEGSRSDSRVHVLNYKNKRLLSTGDDNWFVLTTNKPLGKIRSLTIWSDLKCLSDWNCSHVYLYDVESTKWYFVNVGRWFSASASNYSPSRLERIPVEEVPSVDGVFLTLPYKFKMHFINEFRNTHTIASLFTLRQRSLSTSEQRAIMLIVKFLAIIVMAWIVEEFGYYLIYGKTLDPISSKNLIALNKTTVAMAFAISILAIPFTFPLRMAYRGLYKSRLLQKKMTNPIYLQVASPESLVTTEDRKTSVSAKKRPSVSLSSSSAKSAKKVKVGKKKKKGESKKVSTGETAQPEFSKEIEQGEKTSTSDEGSTKLEEKGFFRKKSASVGRALSRASSRASRVSRLFSTMGWEKEKGEKKKVIFIEDPSERKLSRRISQVLMKKIAWTKKTVREGRRDWKIPLLNWFGPSLFHCVNVSEETFLIKTRKRILQIRIFAALEIILLLSLIWFIIYYKKIALKLPSTGFLILLAMILNAAVLEPVLILLHSAAMFYILKVTNKESYLWNEDQRVNKPTPLGYEEYLHRATRRQYKPLLTTQLSTKRRREILWGTLKIIGFHSVCFGTIWLSLLVLEHSHNVTHFYHIRAITYALSTKNPHLNRPSYEITDVITPGRAIDYLETSVADIGYDSYAGKNISNDGSFWARDEISKPLGAANMILQFIPKGGEGARVTKLMEPYFGSVYGFLSDGDPEKNPIHLGDHELQYMEESYGRVYGKTRESYELRGHNLSLSMIDYESYYTNILNVFGDVKNDGASHHVRVIILTYNYFNAFDRRITTVDALAEFLPSGLGTARLEVQSFSAYELGAGLISSYRNAVIILVLFHLVFTAAEASKYEGGMKAYFLSLNGAVKIVIYPSNVMLWLTDLFNHQSEALNRIIYLPHDEYTDLHQVHSDNWWESVLELIVLDALVADTFIALWRAFGNDSLKKSLSLQCFRNCLCMFLIQLYIATTANVCANVFDRQLASLEVMFFVREAVTIQDQYNEIFLLVTIFVLLICSKACTATFIASYYSAEVSRERQHTLFRAIQEMYHTIPKPGRIIPRAPRLRKQLPNERSPIVEWGKSKSSIKFSLLDGSVKMPGRSSDSP